MHLQRLKLPAFRNLKDFEITFTEGVDDPNVEGGRRTFNSHAVIGANGAGKSNLLEAIIMIFRDLDLNLVAALDYELDYHIRGNRIEITAQAGKRLTVVINGERSSATQLSEHARKYLPSNVFVYYSGKNERIEQLFQAHQRRFIQRQRDQLGEDLLRRLLYCRSGHSQLVLLACLLSKDELFTQLLDLLNIVELDSALFVLKQPYRLRQKLDEKDILEGDNRFWYARGNTVSEFLDKLWQLSIPSIS